MAKRNKTFNVKNLLEHEFKMLNCSDKWKSILGKSVEEPFDMIVYAESGNGKTTFILQLCQELIDVLGRGLYNSVEQGWSGSLQENARTSGFIASPNYQNMTFADKLMLTEMKDEINRMRPKPRFVVIDSIQYLDLITLNQYKKLRAEFPRISWIFISHAESGRPEGKLAKRIEYDVSVKVEVKKGVAYSKSRYGITQPYEIFPGALKNSEKKVNTNNQLGIGF
jgi:hypothetical protein